MNSDADSLLILKQIRNQAFNFQPETDLAQKLFKAKNRLQIIVQDRSITSQEYMDRFQNAVDFVIHFASSDPVYPSLVDATLIGRNLKREREEKTP